MNEAAPLVDLFAGAGGLSTGLSTSGFRPILAVERDPDACETYASLHPNVRLERGPIERLSFRRLRGEVVLVAAGPPCQPFSTGGKRRATEDPRDGFPQLLRALGEIQPDAFLIENVAGLASPASRWYLFDLLGQLKRLAQPAYRITWAILNAADFGVPQKRRRLFIAGTRGEPLWFPDPTHGPDAGLGWVPSGSVLRRAEVIGEPNASIVTFARNPDVRPSPYDGHLFNGGGRPLDLEAPAPTILASAGGNKTPFLDTLDIVPGYHAHLLRGGKPRTGRVPGARRLTVEECAALQTFPAGTSFVGSRSARYTLVGNAVPPMLASAIGRALARQLNLTADIAPTRVLAA